MTSKYNVSNPPLFASGHYYCTNDFQFSISTVNQTVTKPTVLKNNSGITLLYFREGHGEIVVNSRAYPIEKGILMCLASYHYFQLNPSTAPIELVQCQLSYDTFLYIAANPYYNFSKITHAIHPLTSHFEKDALKSVEILLDELIEITNRRLKKEKLNTKKTLGQKSNITDNPPHKIGKQEFLLCMRLVGILHQTYRTDFLSK